MYVFLNFHLFLNLDVSYYTKIYKTFLINLSRFGFNVVLSVFHLNFFYKIN